MAGFAPDRRGKLRCLDANTGKELWNTNEASETREGANIHLVSAPDISGIFLLTNHGDLVLARPDNKGLNKISCFRLLKPTSDYSGQKMA